MARLTTTFMELRMFKCATRYEVNVPNMGRLVPKRLKDKKSFLKKIIEGDCSRRSRRGIEQRHRFHQRLPSIGIIHLRQPSKIE